MKPSRLRPSTTITGPGLCTGPWDLAYGLWPTGPGLSRQYGKGLAGKGDRAEFSRFSRIFLANFCSESCLKLMEMGSLGLGNHPEQVSGRVVDSRPDF